MNSQAQTDTQRCTTCGAPLSPSANGGACLRCALGNALAFADAEHPTGSAETVVIAKPPGEDDGKLPRFGDYQLIEEIARGGMGVVYRARQISLDRIVAVKMLLFGPLASKEFVQRFRVEASAAASLQHPNIVAVHEVGVHQNQHYLVMDYIAGQTLSKLSGGQPLPPRRAAAYVKTIAEAIHFAHERGVLHRDLKPSNVLIDLNDEPHVTDFGLAKRLDADSDLTLSGQILGSPNYMSPEQASGKRGKVGRHSDVYSLGAILFHLLTGRPPFVAESPSETIQLVLEREPITPRGLVAGIPRDLDTICLRCLEKEPGKRYPTAQALAEELDRFLKDEPIRARPVGPTEKAWRWCRRKPVIASLAAGLVLAIAVGFGGVLWQLRRVQQEQLIVRRNLYTADMKLAHQAWEEGNLQQAQTLLREHLPKARREDLRGFEWRYLWALCQDESRLTFTNVNFAHDANAGIGPGLALTADGRTLVAASSNSLRWLDIENGGEVQTLAAGIKPVRAVAASLTQPGVLAYLSDNIQAISPGGEKLLGGGVDDPGSSRIALSPDGSLLASVSHSTLMVKLFNVKSGKQLTEEMPFKDQLNVVFSPDGKYLVGAGAESRSISVLEIPSLKRVYSPLRGHTAWVHGLAFDPSGQRLASSGNDSHIVLWNFPDGPEQTRLRGHRGPVRELAFAPDGRILASGGTDHTVRLWSLDRPGTHTILHGHRGGVRSVLFSKDGKELYTGSDDGSVKVWTLPSGETANVLRHPNGWLHGVAFSPDGTLLGVADSHGKTAVLWEVSARRKIESPIGLHSSAVYNIAFSPDGKFLASKDGDANYVWDLSEKTRAHTFPGSTYAERLAFHPTEPILAAPSRTGSLDFWDLRTGQLTNLLATPPTTGARCPGFSPDRRWIAVGMKDGTVLIGDLETGRTTPALLKHAAAATCVCFSHDSTLLASGGEDHRVILYDLRQRRVIKTIQAHTEVVCALAFTTDDRTLVSTSFDGTIKFWSVANQQLTLTLVHDGGPVTGVSFSPDGRLMATSGSDGTVRLWPAPSFAEIEAAESRKP